MGKRRSKSKSQGVLDPVVSGAQYDSDSTEAPAIGAIVSGMQSTSISAKVPVLTEEECARDEDEQKTSVYREDSVLSEGDYLKAVKMGLESVEKGANVGNGCGVALMSELRRLLLSRYNPPLQLWWAFTSAEKYVLLENSTGTLPQAAAIIDCVSKLLVSLKSLSTMNTSGFVAIAALAPIVALLHEASSSFRKCVRSAKRKDSDPDPVDGKKTRKLVMKLTELIRETLCFVVVCRRRDFIEFKRLSTLPYPEKSARMELTQSFYPPFPLASKHMKKALSKDSLNSAVIAEAVSTELVILQLIAESMAWRSRFKKQDKEHKVHQGEFEEKLKSLARHSVFTGNSLSVSEMLLDTLLEKRLPVGNLLDDEEEKLVRECIIETVLMDPPSFGLLEKAIKEVCVLSNVVFMKRLAVGRLAIQTARAQEHLKRAGALSRRIASWQVPLPFMKWLQAQKRHRLPVTAMLGSQAFLNWVTTTMDEVAFTSIFNRCVEAFSPEVLTVTVDGETKDDEHELEQEEEDLFFVDTAGDLKDDSDVDAAADLAFAEAAKGISKGKTRGKERQPIYRRLPQDGAVFEKTVGRKIIDELEDVNTDTDGEDSTMLEDDSSAKDLAVVEEKSSSDDEPYESLVSKEVDSEEDEEKKHTELFKGEPSEKKHTELFKGEPSEKVEAEKDEEKLVAKPMTYTTTEDVQVTLGKDMMMGEVQGVPMVAVLLSKEESRDGDKDSVRDIELDFERADESEPVSPTRVSDMYVVPPSEVSREGLKDSVRGSEVDLQGADGSEPVSGTGPTETQNSQYIGLEDEGIGPVRIGPIGKQSNQEEISLEKMGGVPNEGPTTHLEVEAVTLLSTSRTSIVDKPEVTGKDQAMVQPTSIPIRPSPYYRKKLQSRRNAELWGKKDPVMVEIVQSPPREVVETEQETLDAFASPKVASSSKILRRSKTTLDKDSESLDAATSIPSVTMENALEMQEAPPSMFLISSKSKRDKGTENTNVEILGNVTSPPLVTPGKDAVVMEPISRSETSSKSKSSKTGTGNIGTEVVDSVLSTAPVLVDEVSKSMEPRPPVEVSLSETSNKSSKRSRKAIALTDTEAGDCVPFGSPVLNEKNREEREATPSSTHSDSLVTSFKSKRSKKVNLDKVVDTVENVVSDSPIVVEKDLETHDVTSASLFDETPGNSKLGKVSTLTIQTDAVENVQSPLPIISGKKSQRHAPSPRSPPIVPEETPSKGKKGKKAAANKESEALGNVGSLASVTSDGDFGFRREGSPSLLLTSDETPSGRKRGRKVRANKDRDIVDSVLSDSPVHMKNDDGIQKAPKSTLVGLHETTNMIQGETAVTADKDDQVVEDIPSSAATLSKAEEQLSSQEALKSTFVDLNETTNRIGGRRTMVRAETDAEVVEDIPSSAVNDSRAEEQLPSQKALESTFVDLNETTNRIDGRSTIIRADKDAEVVEDIPSAAINDAKAEEQLPSQEALKCTFVDLNETTNMIEGRRTMIRADEDAEVVEAIPSSAVNDSKAEEQLPSQAAVDMDQKTVEDISLAALTSSEQAGMSQASIERELETVTHVPSSPSLTARRKSGRKTKPRDPDGNIIPPQPPARRIATRGTTPHVVLEKEEEKVVEQDLGQIVVVTPHKTPRKSKRKVTAQEPQEKVNEVASDQSMPSMTQQCPTSYANLIAAVETGIIPPSTSAQSTPNRGRKRDKAISDDDREESSNPSGTSSRGRKSTKSKVVVDVEVNPRPTSSAQAPPRRGRKGSNTPKGVTDDETDDTQTTPVQATPRRGRKSTNTPTIVADDGTDDTHPTSVQATPRRGRKSSNTPKVVSDDETDDTHTTSVQATPKRRGRKSSNIPKVVTDDESDDTQTTSTQATPRRGRKRTKAKVTILDEAETTSTPSVQVTTSRIEKTVEAKTFHDYVDFDETSSPTDQGTQSRGRRGSKSTVVAEENLVSPSAKTPRKKSRLPSQQPEDYREMKDQSGVVPVFTPRRSKRGAGASQVVGESVDMALSPYRSIKKQKTKLPGIVYEAGDEE